MPHDLMPLLLAQLNSSRQRQRKMNQAIPFWFFETSEKLDQGFGILFWNTAAEHMTVLGWIVHERIGL